MELDAGASVLRPWRAGDREALAQAANDYEVWRNLTDRFPHPYTVEEADEWIARCLLEDQPPRNFAIVLANQAVGGIGLELPGDEKRHMANLGYWLARRLWNQGIATAALRSFTNYAFEVFDLQRLQASVFAWNPASARVLEKCGYHLEGRMRDAVLKGGAVTDELVYGLLRSESPSRSADHEQ
jgi:[ribosomal protein S5]-alanine N-acetyltransferase